MKNISILENKTILITGGAGFIGSSLIERLIENNRIIAVDNFDKNYDERIKEENIKNFNKNAKFSLFKINIENKNELEKIFNENKIDVVVHLAAKVGVRDSFDGSQGYWNTNVFGTKNILELMNEYNVPKLIFASSSSVYGENESETFSEDMLPNPISPYATTKQEAESLCKDFSKRTDINVICLRFFTVYGPKQRPDLAIHKFASLIMEDKPITLFGNGDTERDYTYIDDIVEGIIASIKCENKNKFEIINLGGGHPIKLLTMVNAIEKELGKSAKIEKLPMQKGDVFKTSANINKAKNLLGYEPKTSFEDGIRKMIEWLK